MPAFGMIDPVTARIALPPALDGSPFTTQEAHAAGLGEGRLRGRDLYRPFRGVRVPHRSTQLEQLADAFQRRAADNVYFCSITAARIMRVPLPLRFEQETTLHVGAPSPVRAPRVDGVVGHKFQIDAADIRNWHGLRVTVPERTWCDLATLLSVPDLVAAGDYLIHWELPFTSQEKLRDAMLRHPGRRGRSRLLHAIDLLDDHAESRQESLLRVIVVRAQIPGVVANLGIRTSGGFRYRGDLVIPERKLIIEYQSRFHDGTTEFRADMTRISRLEADGWYVLQVNWDDLNNPRELVQRIRTILVGRPRVVRGQ